MNPTRSGTKTIRDQRINIRCTSAEKYAVTALQTRLNVSEADAIVIAVHNQLAVGGIDELQKKIVERYSDAQVKNNIYKREHGIRSEYLDAIEVFCEWLISELNDLKHPTL